jgi:hypothetical protein
VKTLIVLSLAIGFLLSSCSSTPVTQQKTSENLWLEYRSEPNTHPNIPNCSYAGYRNSEAEIPSAWLYPPTLKVTSFGAKGDGIADDTKAFQKALKSLENGKGGVLFVPAGRYRISGLLRLGGSHTILRGDGPEKTILIFEKSLTEVNGPVSTEDGRSDYSWMGGLIHIGPKKDFDKNGKLIPDYYYGWEQGDTLASVTKPAKRGDSWITVDNGHLLHSGQKVFVTWKNPPDHSLLKLIAGPVLAAYPWDKDGKMLVDHKTFPWPVEIETVKGNEVTLKQPLRLDVRPEWKVEIRAIDRLVEEDGVEDLGIKMISGEVQRHNFEKGFNGIFFHRAWNSWVKNVNIQDPDSGVLMDGAKNITVTGLKIFGNRKIHHGTYSKASHDCLIENFLIESPAIHGINSDILNSGMVWRRGTLKHGTIDMHRGMPFDMIRTDITVNNDGQHGGSNEAGPMQGVHVVHWNIRATGRSDLIYQPDVMPMGALVGIQGIPIDDSEADENFIHGNKGSIIADEGKTPEPSDLFQAQLDFRLKQAELYKKYMLKQ